MSSSLTLAPEVVPRFCLAIDIKVVSPTGQLAKEIARRVGGIEGEALPETPRTLAAASLYLATRLTEPNVSQRELAEVADVSERAVRDAYQTIAVELGVASDPDDGWGVDLHSPAEWPDWVHDYATESGHGSNYRKGSSVKTIIDNYYQS